MGHLVKYINFLSVCKNNSTSSSCQDNFTFLRIHVFFSISSFSSPTAKSDRIAAKKSGIPLLHTFNIRLYFSKNDA